MNNYREAFGYYLTRKRREHGAKFDASDLAPQFIPYYESGQRIEVSRTFPSGEKWVRRGTVGITTGWRPAFLLMRTTRSMGSSDVLGKDDAVIGVVTKKRKPYKRTTRDVWHFLVNYGQGWEHEHTEETREGMKENRKAYQENCAYPLRIVRRREKIEAGQ